jgi:hypothetical protein
MAQDLNEATITRRAVLGGDDTVERSLLRAHAAKSKLDHSWLLPVGECSGIMPNQSFKNTVMPAHQNEVSTAYRTSCLPRETAHVTGRQAALLLAGTANSGSMAGFRPSHPDAARTWT